MEIDSYHDVVAPILTYLGDGKVWTTFELTRQIFPDMPYEHDVVDRRMAQVRRALYKLNAEGIIDRRNMWQPGQTYRHYGWSLRA